jgi:hypothetical protein
VNPYQSPTPAGSENNAGGTAPVEARREAGRRCEACGSANTAAEQALRSKPSILGVIFFGWMFLLIRTAFSRCNELCHDCGAIRRYRSTGSKLALVFLVLVVFLIVIACLPGAE